MVFYSTDYVFGGEERERNYPYDEWDKVRPLNVYGVSKAAGEQLVMQANPRYVVVRSAGLYGTATSRKGWTFPELMINKVPLFRPVQPRERGRDLPPGRRHRLVSLRPEP